MIKGKRITLKPLREEDVPLYASMLADPDMMGEYITARMMSEIAVKKRFSETGLFDEDGGRLVGQLRLHQRCAQFRCTIAPLEQPQVVPSGVVVIYPFV